MPNLRANLSKQIPFYDTYNQTIKKTVELGIAMMLTLLALNTTALAVDKQIVIKFSHVAAMDTPKSKSIEQFKQLVESKTAGKVRVDV